MSLYAEASVAGEEVKELRERVSLLEKAVREMEVDNENLAYKVCIIICTFW